jgi:hypothetical protein
VLSFVDQVNLYLKSAKEPGFVKWDAKNAVWAVWIGVNVSFFPLLARLPGSQWHYTIGMPRSRC